jgi:hypothetical protein
VGKMSSPTCAWAAIDKAAKAKHIAAASVGILGL